ncbi:unnamed protein product [Closterium sp. NIES-53]
MAPVVAHSLLPSRCPFLHCPPVSGGSVWLTVRSSPPLVLYELGVRVRSSSTPLLVSPSVAPDSSVAPPPGSPLPSTPSWHALPSPCLWSSKVSASPPSLACPALPCVEGWQRATIAARGTASGGAAPGDAETRAAAPRGTETWGSETGGAEPGGAEPEGVEPRGANGRRRRRRSRGRFTHPPPPYPPLRSCTRTGGGRGGLRAAAAVCELQEGQRADGGGLVLQIPSPPLLHPQQGDGGEVGGGGRGAGGGLVLQIPSTTSLTSKLPPPSQLKVRQGEREEEAWRQLLLLRHIRHPLTPSPPCPHRGGGRGGGGQGRSCACDCRARGQEEPPLVTPLPFMMRQGIKAAARGNGSRGAEARGDGAAVRGCRSRGAIARGDEASGAKGPARYGAGCWARYGAGSWAGTGPGVGRGTGPAARLGTEPGVG